MLTRRGLLVFSCMLAMLVLFVLIQSIDSALVPGAFLLWFGTEWLVFSLAAHRLPYQIELRRSVNGRFAREHGLWAGKPVPVSVWIRAKRSWPLPRICITDRLPAGATASHPTKGWFRLDTNIPAVFRYELQIPRTGRATLEGLTIEFSDAQGFFRHRFFHRERVVLTVLENSVAGEAKGRQTKRQHQLPGAGIHRHRRGGAGSDLLELRDYVVGDPPKKIAWKVSARRERLMTKEFESEVPVRVTLLLDGSPAARTGIQGRSPFTWSVSVAGQLASALLAARDPVRLAIVTDDEVSMVSAGNGQRHLVRILSALSNALGRQTLSAEASVRRLLPAVLGVADEVYPDLMESEVNERMWFWLRARKVFRASLWYVLIGSIVPALAAGAYLWTRDVLVIWIFAAVISLYLLFWVFRRTLGVFLRFRRVTTGLPAILTRRLFGKQEAKETKSETYFQGRLVSNSDFFSLRKSASAVLTAWSTEGPALLTEMLFDDALFSKVAQEFLFDHGADSIPDEPLNAAEPTSNRAKLELFQRTILRSILHGKDNELFVLMLDPFELAADFEILVPTIRLARARHHEVVLVCQFPSDIAARDITSSAMSDAADQDESLKDRAPTNVLLKTPPEDELSNLLSLLSKTSRSSPDQGMDHALRLIRYRSAYRKLAGTFRRLGAAIICMEESDSIQEVLRRVELIRRAQSQRGRTCSFT